MNEDVDFAGAVHGCMGSSDDDAPPSPRAAAQGTGPMRFENAVCHPLLRSILDHLPFGVAVLGERLQLLLVNRAAVQECARSRHLRLDGERLVLEDDREAVGFARALTAARRGRWSLVRLRADGEILTLALAPLGALGAYAHPVLVVFGIRSPAKRLAIQFFARDCGMTNAEERVLAALSEGLAPREIADLHGVAISTIRTQLDSIRAKAEAESTTALMRTLGCLPPIMPAVMPREGGREVLSEARRENARQPAGRP